MSTFFKEKICWILSVCVLTVILSGCSFFIPDGEKDNENMQMETETEYTTEEIRETEADGQIEKETESTEKLSEEDVVSEHQEEKEDSEQKNKTYTYKIYEDPFNIVSYSVCKSAANVYDKPDVSGNVIDKFGYKHMMFVIGKCNETGWYKIVYDNKLCDESNYREHLGILYDYTSVKPAIDPDDTYHVLFSRTAQNVKTAYINPKDVIMTAAWCDEVYHLWNGVKYYESYSATPETLEYFKKLCFAPRRTFIELGNEVGVFYETGDIPYMENQQLFADYALEHGYCYTGGGGCWIDSRAKPPAYYYYRDFLRFEEQYVIVSTSTFGSRMNWDYVEKEYGYTEDIRYDFQRYIKSEYFDKSVGVWDEAEQTIRYNGYEFIQVCQRIEYYKEQKLPPWDYLQ